VDAAVIALVSAISTAAIGGIATVVVAVVNSRRERTNTAHNTLLAAKDERILFKDEQLADCERDKDYWKSRALELEKRV
jgi:hypothetical protein